ncbi:Ig-like domain-containing protein, partial [Pseudoxanthomonas sp. F11]|uniref:Ig-like domain-containing protein n=1 Tax=Pseudoxanthomonas sp. F11 TaxID=3126308 RepID=UPI00300D9DFF
PTLYVDGVAVPATYDPVTGTLTPNSPLADGPHSITYTLTNGLGTESPASPALVLTVDATPPPAGTLTLSNFTDSGTFSNDFVSNDNTFDLAVAGVEAGATVTYEVSTNGGGTWSPTTSTQSALADGSYQFRVVLTDAAGNSSTSNTVSVTVDTVAPAAPTVATVTTLTGTAEPNSVINLYNAGGTLIHTTTANGSGNWSVPSAVTAMPGPDAATVGTVTDNATFRLSSVYAVGSANVGGTTYVIGASLENGISAFRLQADGSLTQTGLPASANQGPLADVGGLETLATITTTSGDTFVYVGGGLTGVRWFELGADGSLTPGGYQGNASGSHLFDMEAMTTLTVNGVDYLVTSAISGTTGVDLWQINPTTGALTFRGGVLDNATLFIDDLRGMDVARLATGEQYIVASGGNGGVSVFRVDPITQTLVNTFNVADNATLRVNLVDFVTTYTTHGGTFAYVGGQDGGFSVFRVNADGTLTNIQNFVSGNYVDVNGTSQTVTLTDLRGADVSEVNSTLVVGSNGSATNYYFRIDRDTGLVTFSDRQTGVPGLQAVNATEEGNIITGHSSSLTASVITGGEAFEGSLTATDLAGNVSGATTLGAGGVSGFSAMFAGASQALLADESDATTSAALPMGGSDPLYRDTGGDMFSLFDAPADRLLYDGLDRYEPMMFGVTGGAGGFGGFGGLADSGRGQLGDITELLTGFPADGVRSLPFVDGALSGHVDTAVASVLPASMVPPVFGGSGGGSGGGLSTIHATTLTDPGAMMEAELFMVRHQAGA